MQTFAAANLDAHRGPRVGEALSGVFGSVSMVAWICLLLPQLIANYKAKSAEALSMKFLFIWLLGDICNLSGALFTSLAPSTIALASYFCVADIILISQCTYYNTLNARRRAAAARRESHHHHHHHHHHARSTVDAADDNLNATSSHPAAASATESDPLLPNGAGSANTNGDLPGSHRRHEVRRRDSSGLTDPLSRIITGEDDTPDSQPWLHNAVSLIAIWVVGAAGWFVSYKMGAWDVPAPGDGDGEPAVEDPLAVVGMVLGWASAVCYLFARIPQIIKNYHSKSCEGLSLLFFLLSLTGNFTYGASVISYSQERDYFLRAVPWLLGSLGTIVEDCIIFVQFRIYSPERQPKSGATP
ncbi:PQ loop repeat-domain-containing protein [Chaetomium sp. MPI-SDFR-AT-0129]|nr:PQ loop repeat-domain-containing protein [Chaetomium sp. MPI-SDFR-AT-0129]